VLPGGAPVGSGVSEVREAFWAKLAMVYENDDDRYCNHFRVAIRMYPGIALGVNGKQENQPETFR
jgi:hypothetical protein